MSEAAPFVPPDRAQTAEFTVRSYEASDGEKLAEALNTSFDHLKAMPWAAPHWSAEQTDRLCREFRARYLMGTDFTLSIWSSDESRLLGGTGYHLREGPLETGNAEIGMWIRADAAHRGLGTRVLRELLRWGFSAWPWQRIAWRCDGYNLASQRVAEKAGLAREGVLRAHRVLPDGTRGDTFLYAALRGEWRDDGAEARAALRTRRS